MLYEESLRASQVGLVILGEDSAAAWAIAITAPDELSLQEQRVVEGMIWLEIENWRAVFKLSQVGLIEEDWKERVDHHVSFNFDS